MENGPSGGAAAGIFALLLILHLFLRLCSQLIPSSKQRPQERELLKEIKSLHRSANELSSPATFAKSAKIRRVAAVKEKELAALRRKLKLEKNWWRILSFAFPLVLKAAVYLLLARRFWRTSVADIPVALLKPSEYLLYTGEKDTSRDIIAVGIVPWLVMSSRVIEYLSDKISGHFERRTDSQGT